MKRVTDLGFWMDPYLISNLDSVCYNMGDDWDFIGVITGHGMTRVGKSVLAQQIGYYVAHKMGTTFSLNNVVFSGKELINIAHKLPPNSVIIYDEARGELDSKKSISKVSKLLQDFFAECGMYNHMILLVMPNFFELNKSLATSRTEFLIDVIRTKERKKDKDGAEVTKFKRGSYVFYNKQNKKWLYINGKKKFESYEGSKYNFNGGFPNTWILDVDEYKKKKIKFLKRERDVDENMPHRYKRITKHRNLLVKALVKDYGVSTKEVAKLLSEPNEQLPIEIINNMITTANKY